MLEGDLSCLINMKCEKIISARYMYYDSLKPILYYAFLACVWSEKARGFALGRRYITF